MSDSLQLRVQASSFFDIGFRYDITEDLGMTREEWDDLEDVAQMELLDEITRDAYFSLIDVTATVTDGDEVLYE